MQYLRILFQVLTKFISETFPKVAVLKRLPKGAMTSSFVEHPVLNFLSEKIDKSAILIGTFFQVLTKFNS